MTLAITALLVTALIMFGANPLAKWWARNEAHTDRLIDDALEVPATEGSPIYDRLVCEQIERQEGWS